MTTNQPLRRFPRLGRFSQPFIDGRPEGCGINPRRRYSNDRGQSRVCGWSPMPRSVGCKGPKVSTCYRPNMLNLPDG